MAVRITISTFQCTIIRISEYIRKGNVTTVMVILRESCRAIVEFVVVRSFSYWQEWTVLHYVIET
jgi:hypothetical protein